MFIPALNERYRYGVAQHGERFDPTELEAGRAEYGPWYANGARVRVRTEYGDGAVYERTGTIGTTTGWRPSWLLIARANNRGSSDLLNPARDRVVAVKIGRRYEPVGSFRKGVKQVNNDTDNAKQKSYMDKVMALLAKAESTQFPEEAQACVAKAQELMVRYAIDEAMLRAANPARGTSDRIASLTIVVDAPYSEAKSSLAFAVSRNNDCRAVYWGSSKRRFIEVTGFQSDLETVQLLFSSLSVQAVNAMLDNDRRQPLSVHGKTWRNSFLRGYAAQIDHRLREARKVAQADATAAYGAAGAGTRSVELVLRDKAQDVNAEFQRLHPHTRTKHVAGATNFSSYANGRAAANNANLNQSGVGSGNRGALSS